MSAPYARMRLHGPGMVFDWYETYEKAAQAIDHQAEKLGDQIRKFTVVGYFPHLDSIDRVLAERERCAKIAEQYDAPETGGLYCGCPEDIAAAIRKGE